MNPLSSVQLTTPRFGKLMALDTGVQDGKLFLTLGLDADDRQKIEPRLRIKLPHQDPHREVEGRLVPGNKLNIFVDSRGVITAKGTVAHAKDYPLKTRSLSELVRSVTRDGVDFSKLNFQPVTLPERANRGGESASPELPYANRKGMEKTDFAAHVLGQFLASANHPDRYLGVTNNMERRTSSGPDLIYVGYPEGTNPADLEKMSTDYGKRRHNAWKGRQPKSTPA
jgi:hypothetical protein